MMKLAILFALVAVASANVVPRLNPLSPTGRIVGGVATSIDEVPYQVSLQVLGSHFCGGSIIADTWILTAAHCIAYPATWVTVRAGSTLSSTGGSTHEVASFIAHPDYFTWRGFPIHDIALVKLSSALTLDSTRATIPLYNAGEEAVAGAPAVITGWGRLAEGGDSSIVLQSATVPIVSKADCNDAYSTWGGIPADQICAAVPEGGVDTCHGDSGGPLVIGGRVAGIVSWGNGCARAGWPGVYAEVAAYRTWITENSGV